MSQPIDELIDDFVAGRLSPEEASELHNSIQADPALQQELKFQQDIQYAIVDAKKAALKSRLQKIDVSTIPSNKWDLVKPWMAFTAGFTSLILATAIALPFLDENAKEVTSVVNATTQVTEDSRHSQANTAPTAEMPSVAKADEPLPQSPIVEPNSAEVMAKAQATIKEFDAESAESSTSRKTKSPTLAEPSEPKLASNEVNKLDNSNADAGMEVAGNANAKPLDIVTINDGKNDLQYKNYDGKLYLYGDFKGKIYELIEINGRLKKYFLFYNGNYYSLKSNQKEMKPLQLITDSGSIEDLDNRRKAK